MLFNSYEFAVTVSDSFFCTVTEGRTKAVDKTCRNHGRCSYCLGNHTHKYKIAEDKMLQKELVLKKVMTRSYRNFR